jgi:hypothetical protein
MNYATTAARAAAQIKAKGQPITITRAQDGNGEFDPATGAYVPVDPLTFSGYAVASNYSQNLVDGALIQQGDKLFTVAASGLGCVPMASDSLTDAAGDVWSVVNVGIVSPAGVALLYKVQGRK